MKTNNSNNTIDDMKSAINEAHVTMNKLVTQSLTVKDIQRAKRRGQKLLTVKFEDDQLHVYFKKAESL